MISVPLVAILLLGAPVLFLLPKAWRSPAHVLFPAVVLVLLATGRVAPEIQANYVGYSLVLQRLDSLALPFVVVFALVLLIGGLYGFHFKDTAEKAASLIYGGAAIGTVLAGDLLTLYLFWEILAWSAVYLIWAPRRDASGRAGMRYVLFHLFGGSLLLAGIWLHSTTVGSFALDTVQIGTPAAWLMLLGFAVNAAVVPLHAWLPDAYPEATITGSVFLSAFTTKTAVYALARVFAGWDILIVAGVVMAIYGVLFAVLANDVRKLLSYHIISQVGYMVAGIGLGTALSLSGSTAHAFAHVLYKALLFMGAGGLIYATGTGRLSELGRLSGRLPWLLGLYMVGAVSISGFPLFSGFVSKSLVIEAFAVEGRAPIVWALELASVGTFLSVGLKLPVFAWGNAGRGVDSVRPLPAGMILGMAAAAVLSLAIGLFPGLFYSLLPYPVDYEPYTAAHVSEIMQLMTGTALGFFLLQHKLVPKTADVLDVDWTYRIGSKFLHRQLVTPLARGFSRMDAAVESGLERFVQYSEQTPGGRMGTRVESAMLVLLTALILLAGWILTSS